MAGYVVHHDDVSTASVVYCELHAHEGDMARVALYENDFCQVPVGEICIHENAMCSEKIGINCSCYSVEDHQFSTRTLAERKLWLRAISNVRVKLQNRAPNPSQEELDGFRMAIKDHILTIKPALDGPGFEDPDARDLSSPLKTAPAFDPLLQRCHARRPPCSHNGTPLSLAFIAEPPRVAKKEPTEAARLPELKAIQLELNPMALRAAPRPSSQSSLERPETELAKSPPKTGEGMARGTPGTPIAEVTAF